MSSNRICADARRQTGLQNYRDTEVEARLDVLVQSIEREADLHSMGRFLTYMHFRDLLKTRMLLENEWERTKGFETETIRRPIVITGMPRSGSSFLHELLARDPGNRAPLAWEVMSPLPMGANSKKRRMWRTAACLWLFRRLAPRADTVHPLRAETPHECVAIHSYTFLSREFVISFRIPEYEAFLNSVDFFPAYAWQRRFLQHLQWKEEPKQWVLKAPDHVFTLESLLRVFPDAVVIQTHRNPLEVLKSSSRLLQVVRQTFAYPRDRREIANGEAGALADGMDRITRFREEHPELGDRFLDVNYTDLIADPMATVRRLYQQLDMPLTNSAFEQMQGLAGIRNRYGGARTAPSLTDLGLDAQREVRRFAGYCARFGIQPM